MNTITRDDTIHGVEYVTKQEAEREITELNERLIDLLAAFDGNAHRKPKSQENLDDPNEQTFTRM